MKKYKKPPNTVINVTEDAINTAISGRRYITYRMGNKTIRIRGPRIRY